MPAKALSATINIVSNITLILTKADYLWTTKSDIQRFLNNESVISIADAYPEADAMSMENGVVREIITYLSSFYEIDEDSDIASLKELTAMLTAARIGTAFSSAISNDPTSWAYRYENSVWASLQQRVVNQDISDLTVVSVPLWKRLIYGKRRELTIRQETR